MNRSPDRIAAAESNALGARKVVVDRLTRDTEGSGDVDNANVRAATVDGITGRIEDALDCFFVTGRPRAALSMGARR